MNYCKLNNETYIKKMLENIAPMQQQVDFSDMVKYTKLLTCFNVTITGNYTELPQHLIEWAENIADKIYQQVKDNIVDDTTVVKLKWN